MNKRYIPLLIILTFALAALAPAWTNGTVHAQGGCTDAAGRPIPCPNNDNKKTPTPAPLPTATFTPTATVTTIPTSTSLPISNPADDGSTEVKWSGTCSGVNKNTTCTDKLINACNKAGGTPDASFDDEADTTTITCTLPAILEPTPLPLGIPTDDGTTEGDQDWEGFCSSKNKFIGTCLVALVKACTDDGGSVSKEHTNGGIKVTCTYPAMLPIGTATALPFVAPEDNWIGRCTEADVVNGSLQDCFDRFTCEDGTLVTKVDLYSGDGAVYDFYCIPHKPTFPPGGWLPWIAGLGGLLIGMLLPAIQKVRFKPGKEPQAASGNTSQTTWGSGNNVRGKAHYSDMSAKPEESEAAVAIPAFMKNARKAKRAEANTDDSSDEESMQLKAKRGEVMPQTREHVLLANPPADPSEAKSNPKPPPPPPTPPSSPRPSKGDFNSDGQVDPADFVP